MEFDNARVLITDMKIEAIKDIIPILEQISRLNQPLLIIAVRKNASLSHHLRAVYGLNPMQCRRTRFSALLQISVMLQAKQSPAQCCLITPGAQRRLSLRSLVASNTNTLYEIYVRSKFNS